MSRHGAYPRPAPLRAAGLCGIVSALCFVAADALGSALRPGYSPVSDAISELIETGAPNKALIDAFLLGFHGLVIPFAIGLHREVRARPRGWIAPLFLAGAGCLGVVLTLFFPCDPGCRPLTPQGTAHIFIAVPMGFRSSCRSSPSPGASEQIRTGAAGAAIRGRPSRWRSASRC